MNENATSGGRLTAVVVAILVVAIAAAALISSRRPAAEFDRATPEGAVQAFFRTLESKDWEGAREGLSSDLQAVCDAADLANSDYEFSQVVLEDQSTAGEQTFITVSVVRVDVTDPLSPSRFEDRLDFTLVDEGGRAKISILPWPFFCER
jgi:hypothetical protein